MKYLSAFILLFVLGCSKGPAHDDLIGSWNAEVSELAGGPPVFVLKLQPADRFELSSMAGVIHGTWSVSGKDLTLKATGMDDGYNRSTNDSSWSSMSRPVTFQIVSKTELTWDLSTKPSSPAPSKFTFKKQ